LSLISKKSEGRERRKSEIGKKKINTERSDVSILKKYKESEGRERKKIKYGKTELKPSGLIYELVL
jgi:hypothetical protein